MDAAPIKKSNTMLVWPFGPFTVGGDWVVIVLGKFGEKPTFSQNTQIFPKAKMIMKDLLDTHDVMEIHVITNNYSLYRTRFALPPPFSS